MRPWGCECNCKALPNERSLTPASRADQCPLSARASMSQEKTIHLIERLNIYCWIAMSVDCGNEIRWLIFIYQSVYPLVCTVITVYAVISLISIHPSVCLLYVCISACQSVCLFVSNQSINQSICQHPSPPCSDEETHGQLLVSSRSEMEWTLAGREVQLSELPGNISF